MGGPRRDAVAVQTRGEATRSKAGSGPHLERRRDRWENTLGGIAGSMAVVYLVGRECSGAGKIASELTERNIRTSCTGWNEFPVNGAAACILLSPPETQEERRNLALLVRNGTPLFFLNIHPVYNLFGRDRIVKLPCRFEPASLSIFLSWLGGSPSVQEHARDSEREANRQMVEEMRLASELQKSLLPRSTPREFPVNVTHKYVPYQYIGGDFFDFVALDDTRLGIVIADASGHGVPAAFVTAMFKSAFNLFAVDDPSPAATLAKLNAEFVRTIHTDHYLTAFYAVIDTDTMRCTFCNAGHPKQLLLRSGGTVSELTSMGFLLGSIDTARYADETVDLAPGDRIVLFTDGVIETTNADREQFGRDRIAGVLRNNHTAGIEDLSNTILSELVMFMDQPVFEDDVTILIAEVMESL